MPNLYKKLKDDICGMSGPVTEVKMSWGTNLNLHLFIKNLVREESSKFNIHVEHEGSSVLPMTLHLDMEKTLKSINEDYLISNVIFSNVENCGYSKEELGKFYRDLKDALEQQSLRHGGFRSTMIFISSGENNELINSLLNGNGIEDIRDTPPKYSNNVNIS